MRDRGTRLDPTRRLTMCIHLQQPQVRKGMHARRARPCIVSSSESDGGGLVARTTRTTVPECSTQASRGHEMRCVATPELSHIHCGSTRPMPRASHGQSAVGMSVTVLVAVAVMFGGTWSANAEVAVNTSTANRTAPPPRPDPPYGIPDSVIPYWRQRHYQDRIIPPEGRYDPISKVFVCVSPKAGSTSFYRWLFRVSTDGVEFDDCETKKDTDHPHRMSDCWQDSGLPGHERHHRVNFTDPTL